MSTPENPDRKAEIEGWIEEANERAERQDAAHRDRLIQMAVDRQMEQLGPDRDAIVAQAVELGDRLAALGLLDLDEDEPLIPLIRVGDETFVGIEVDGLRYAFGGVGAGDLITVRRQVGGHNEYGVLDDNGQVIRWYLADDPRTVSNN